MTEFLIDYTEENGLVFCDNYGQTKNNYEKLYLSEVNKLNAEAVLFRRFYKDDDKSKPYKSVPAVCIFKEEDIHFNSDQHVSLHAALWSSGNSEIYIIYSDTKIVIVNSRKPAIPNNEVLTIDDLILAKGTLQEIDKKRFSADLFESGIFWEQKDFAHQLDEQSSPHIHLMNYLMSVRRKFLNKITGIHLKPTTIDKLLVVSMLVKFLEEIKDVDGSQHTLSDIYKKHKVESFVDAVKKGCILHIFNDLGNEFNGKIFDNFNTQEREAIDKSNLSLLAQFLKANIDIEKQQFFLWEQYSFKHLPAEVISAVYENFIQAEAERDKGMKEKGVVYTPIHLVNFLIDESMPLEDAKKLFKKNKFKVLDPACGSGVFLVAAYKRMLQWWVINNSVEGEIKFPNSKISQKILQDNIYGVDVKETAVLVSIFGLTTALLDKLQPKEIWSNLKLSDLSKRNVIKSNFFEWASKQNINKNEFDLVIGNPPFNPESDKRKKDVLEKSFIQSLEFNQVIIPRNNFALHFFEASMILAKKTCMILPSSVMLYDTSKIAINYRRKLFTNNYVSDIFDFTHLRRDLFHKTADTPVIAIIAEKNISKRNPINHTVIKRMISSEKKIRFEIDYYDQHKVPWNWAVSKEKQFIWKVNLLGGGRLFQLIYRLKSLRTLREYIKEQEGWKQARGFEGKGKFTIENCDRIVDIKSSGTPEIKHDITIEARKLKDEFMYEPPVLIIDQVLGEDKIPSSFISKTSKYSKKNHLYYNRDFIGISAPEIDEKKLNKIAEVFQQGINSEKLNYQLFLLAISSSSLVLTETDINKSEILNVPFPRDLDYLYLTKEEAILQKDVLKYYRHLGKSISKNSSGFILNKTVKNNQLKSYSEILCDTLNKVYEKPNKAWQIIDSCISSSFAFSKIGFGNKNNKKNTANIGSSIESLLHNNLKNRGALFKRVVKFYKNEDDFDCVFLIKPRQYRYWLESIALKDADDIFLDLREEGF